MTGKRINPNDPGVREIVYATLRWVRICKAEGYIQSYHRHGVPTYADASHSSLLERLLNGEEPYEKPPPKAYGYPDVRAAEEAGMPRDPNMEKY